MTVHSAFYDEPSAMIGSRHVRNLARLVAGRDKQGNLPVPPGNPTRFEEIAVTVPNEAGVGLLTCRPVTGGATAQVQMSAAVKGVAVNDIVYVDHYGVAKRIAAGLKYPKPLASTNSGDEVATINNHSVAVGGSVDLTSSDVGASTDSHHHHVAYGLTWNTDITSLGDAGSISLQAINDNRHNINRIISMLDGWQNDLNTSIPTSVPQA